MEEIKIPTIEKDTPKLDTVKKTEEDFPEEEYADDDIDYEEEFSDADEDENIEDEEIIESSDAEEELFRENPLKAIWMRLGQLLEPENAD